MSTQYSKVVVGRQVKKPLYSPLKLTTPTLQGYGLLAIVFKASDSSTKCGFLHGNYCAQEGEIFGESMLFKILARKKIGESASSSHAMVYS